jgi:hypothetical protein
MTRVSKSFAAFIILIIAISSLSLLMAKPANGQTIPTLTFPQFAVKFVNASYNVTTTNSYTGQSQTQLINNNSIEIMVKNQPFNYLNNGLTYQIYFNVRVKPHFSNIDNWTEVYPLENLTSSQANENGFPYAWYILPESPPQSNLDYTTIAFPVIPTELYGALGYDVQRPYTGHNTWLPTFLDAIPSGAQLDFQIEALVGHNSSYWYIQHPFTPTVGGFSAPAVAYDSASGWSNTQTITIGEASATTSPTPTPTVPEFSSWTIQLLLTIMVATAGLLVYHKKHKRQHIPHSHPHSPS